MADVFFLTVDDILEIHRRQIELYSPTESTALRDNGLLDSATFAPRQTFDGEYLYSTIAAMAVAYLVGIAMNHPFENGNKRAAFTGLRGVSLYKWVCTHSFPRRGDRSNPQHSYTQDRPKRSCRDYRKRA